MALSAQDVDLAGSQLNLNALPLTLSYEGKIGAKQSLTLAGGLGYGYYFSASSSGESYSSFVVIPVFYGSFRNYYTRRAVKKDNLRSNSGNYVGLYASYQLEALGEPSSFDQFIVSLETSNVYTVGPVWGIQRNYASGIHLGLSLGIGIIGGEYIETGVTGIGEFEFGFVLFQN